MYVLFFNFLLTNILAIYLDPRFQWSLSEVNKYSAKSFLRNIWDLMIWLENGAVENIEIEIVQAQNDEIEENVDDDLEQYTESQSTVSLDYRNTSTNQNSSQSINISQLLDGFNDISRVHHSTDIIHFWNDLKNSKHELCKLAMVMIC